MQQCRLRGEFLAAQLREHVLPLAHVGDVRGKGLFWGIEFVADNQSKAPFAYAEGVAERVAGAVLARGAAVYPGTGCVSSAWEVKLVAGC